ncbi:MAG: GNAT family N-acetyltransferase [Halioglobus sp.]
MRQNVFIIEQDCLYPDLDDLDQDAMHMTGRNGESLQAYQRCLAPGVCYQESSIGRIIVAPFSRGTQLGRELVQRGIDHNRSQWPDHGIQIGAQAQLTKFYSSLGFVSLEDEYMEDGILHVHMLLE